MALRQLDLKCIVAYSSISHMNSAILGFMTLKSYGILGGILIMLSHGITSAGLFVLIGVLYDRYHTRLLPYYGGLSSIMPMFSVFCFIFTLGNFSFPITPNFVGEMVLLVGLSEVQAWTSLVILLISSFLNLASSMWLFSRLCFGTLNTNYIKVFTDLNRRETYILSLLIFIGLYLGLCPSYIISSMEGTIKSMCQVIQSKQYFF